MSEPGNFDDMREGNVDPYTTESSADIYTTPEVSMDTADVIGDEPSAPVAVTDTHGLFSGNGQPDPYNSQQNDPYNSQPAIPYGGQPNVPYGAQQGDPYSGIQNNSYYNPYQGSAPYGTSQPQQGADPYQNPSFQQDAMAYGGSLYDNNVPYNNSTYNNNIYNNNSYGNTPYGSSPYGAGNNAYGSNPYDANGYGGPYQGANPYGGQQFGGAGGQPPYGSQPFQDSPYSPYATPQKKAHTGLIVTVVVIIILLFIVAICALAYRAIQLADERDFDVDEYINGNKYDFEDDYEYHQDDYDDDFFGYDNDDDYFYGDDYDYSYDYDDKYYSLQDDLKYDLSYEVEFEYYEYDTDDEDVSILVTYPVISGDNVPNLDTLNDAIYSEVTEITEYFEEEYEPHMNKNEDSYFSATSIGYVTYMEEDKLSVVFQEHVYADTYLLAYLYCINIDMDNGVILDNEEMLSIDDSFSVEFRTRSDEQNGEIYSLTNMTDQEITSYFNSSDLIVFYTPMGMEIGFNYEDGWVTVTYEEYEQYLNVF